MKELELLQRDDVKADDVRDSWLAMTEGMLDGLFLTRTAVIRNELLTAEEADKFIMEKSREYMNKYDAMSDGEIRKKMERQIVEHLLERILMEG